MEDFRQVLHLCLQEMRLDDSSLGQLHDLDGVSTISDDHTDDCQRARYLCRRSVTLPIHHCEEVRTMC